MHRNILQITLCMCNLHKSTSFVENSGQNFTKIILLWPKFLYFNMAEFCLNLYKFFNWLMMIESFHQIQIIVVEMARIKVARNNCFFGDAMHLRLIWFDHGI